MRGIIALTLIVMFALAGCSTLPENNNRIESHAFTDIEDTMLGRELTEHRAAHGKGDGFVLLGNGLDAFTARAVLAELAERSLDVQYYLYHEDMVGRLFTAILLKAADRGVRVRLLVDDMDLSGRDQAILALNSHPNIQVRIFNPFDRGMSRLPQFVTGLGSITRRMHNKSFTADNAATILGGRNIGNEYFQANPTVDFADLDVLAMGDVVKQVSASFDLYWNSPQSYPADTLIKKELTDAEKLAIAEQMHDFMAAQEDSAYIQSLRNSRLAQQLRAGTVPFYKGNANVVVDHPDKIVSARDASELHLVTQLAPYFDGIRKELIILSPYFVPGKEGVAYLKSLIERGIKVKILTNSLASNDVSIVHAGYSKYRKALLQAGVELYEMNKRLTPEQREAIKGVEGSSKASLHAKTFVLDREKVFIGSLNLDPRSFYENTEIGLVLDQPELAGEMAARFDRDIARSAFRLELEVKGNGRETLLWHGFEGDKQVTFDADPYASLWRRFTVGLMSLLPVESQL